MAPDHSLPDYYAILQVNPAAEPEIIVAAYRRLMLKYHPDTLTPEMSSDPTLDDRVRLINEAFEVLSNPFQRAVYDKTISQQAAPPEPEIDPNVETRIHMVRCARTKQKYHMLLGRRKGTKSLFRVLGFESVDAPKPEIGAPPQVASLPSPSRPADPLSRLLGKLPKLKKNTARIALPESKFPSASSINDMFDESPALNFGEINFAGWKCPACNGEHTHPNGVISHWCRCSACGRIYCAGNIHSTKLGDFTQCPWCGRRARITTIIHPGDEGDMPVRGEVGKSSNAKNGKPRFADPKRRSLPGK